jgi:hypothetical protein
LAVSAARSWHGARMISAGLGHPAKRVFRRTTREASLFGRLSLTAPISCPHRVRVQEKDGRRAHRKILLGMARPVVAMSGTSRKGRLDIGAHGVKRSIATRQLAATLSAVRALISTNSGRSPSRSPEHVRHVPKMAGLERF